MRKALSRVAAVGVGVALTTLMLPVGQAAATTSDACPETSIKLVTTRVLESDYNRIWAYSPTSTRTLVCFDFPFQSIGGGVIVVDVMPGGSPPSVTPGTNPLDCGFELLGQNDPVPFRLAIDIPKSMVCLTVNDTTTTLAFHAGAISGPPRVEIWRDGSFSWLDVAACPVEYAMWQVAEGPDTCMTTSERII